VSEEAVTRTATGVYHCRYNVLLSTIRKKCSPELLKNLGGGVVEQVQMFATLRGSSGCFRPEEPLYVVANLKKNQEQICANSKIPRVFLKLENPFFQECTGLYSRLHGIASKFRPTSI
jgi:hypothetical protein